MSDDLERAVKSVRAFYAGSTGGNGDAFVAHSADDIARAALLSFLDMDEAGVERIEAVALEELDYGNPYKDDVAANIVHAVLQELRKMAGEKEA